MVNDEFTQIHRAMFNRISLGLVLIGSLISVAILATLGAESSWFIYAVALVVVAAVAYLVSWVGRTQVASYLLVLGLIALAGVLIYQPNKLSGLELFPLIPIVIVSGLLLPPVATLVLTGALIASTFAAAILAGELDMLSTAILFVTGGILLIVALLLAAQKNNMSLLNTRLAQSRMLLKERALELMQAVNRIEWLDSRNRDLEKDLKQSRQSASELQTVVSVEGGQMVDLIQGTADTLAASINQLEDVLDAVADLPALNGHQEAVETAWQRLHTLRTLAVHLEDLAQVEDDDFSLALEPVDLRQLIQEVASTGRGLTRGKDIEVRVEVVDDIPDIQADPARLRQVLLHLISNAINFTDQGVVEIRAELDGQQAIVLVSDTGIGMSSDEASQVFEPFGRGHSPEAKGRQGSGLGLAISRRLVELHGGRMWVTSVEDSGSTFYVSLPLKKSVRPVAAPLPAKSIKTTLRLDKVATPTAIVAAAAAVTTTTPDVSLFTDETLPGEEDTIVSTTPQDVDEPDDATVVTPEVVAAAQDDTVRIIRTEPRRQAKSASTQPIQPVHRFQPKYIRRFGFILLGILGLILALVAVLAIFNPPASEEQVAGGKSAFETTITASLAASTGTPDLPVVAIVPSETAVEVAVVEPTPTDFPPTFTATPRPTDTSVPSPTSSASPLPPTQTPTPTATPLPPSPTATTTATRLPFTATPAVEVSDSGPAVTSSPKVAVSEATIEPTAPAPPQITYSGVAGGAISPDSRISWSTGGQALYSDVEDGGRDIFVMPKAGTQPVNLTNSASDDVQPAWSPDGSRIAFSSGRTGSFKIFAMGTDGQDLVQLTHGRGFDEWPAWSPDGNQLAFVSDRDGNVEIYTMNADGSNQQRRTNHPAEDWPVTWSPDGLWLVFSSKRDGNWNLYLLSVVGGEPRQLTDNPADEVDPVWLSDGSIAFAHNGSGNWDIYTLWPNASQLVPDSTWTRITESLSDERFPAQQLP